MWKDNPLMDIDGYALSHPYQYPAESNAMFSYVETRGNKLQYNCGKELDGVIFFGLQEYIKEYLLKPITQENIDEAEPIIINYGLPFDRKGFEKIVKVYGGYYPFKIKAPKEGTRVPFKNVYLTIECDDPELFWVASFVEAQIVRLWYPINVATISKLVRDNIYKYLKLTSEDPEMWLPTRLHDFGARGSPCKESSGIAGAAHLVSFRGTDTMMGLAYAHDYYDAKNPLPVGESIPAMQHSTVSAFGMEFEVEAYRNMINQFGFRYGKVKNCAAFACVSDTYNIFNAAEHIWGEQLKAEVLNSGSIVVIRPDSGEPKAVVLELLKILDDKFGHTVNKLGFKVLNNVRIIQGDGVNPDSIMEIILALYALGWSLENIAFGMGGALHQQHNRDTFKIAMKCSWIKVGNEWREIFKDPITDKGKVSKKGPVTLFRDYNGKIVTRRIYEKQAGDVELLEVVYDHGKLIRDQTFAEIRALADNA